MLKDELSKLYDDPISHFREVLKEETLLEKQQKKIKYLIYQLILLTLIVTI